mmetsp:Transcript_50075/g.138931  ORF Transcript_50075/g.138931 Transcript_50075/m.138931 type:complete len:259 (+) Transcript_50075:307-1083(+)
MGFDEPPALPPLFFDLLFFLAVGTKKYSSRSSFLVSTSMPSFRSCLISFSSFFSSTSLVAVKLLQNATVCSMSVISWTYGCSSSFSASRTRRVFSYSAWRAARSSAAFSWRTRRCSSWYLRYSRSFSRNSSRNSARSLTFSAICLPMASRFSMISGKSPSWPLRSSMSAAIFSCTFFLPSRKSAICSLIEPICSLKLEPTSRVARPASRFFTWDTFGLFFLSSWISFSSSFSSLRGMVSVQSLNSMSAMRWSISSSFV